MAQTVQTDRSTDKHDYYHTAFISGNKLATFISSQRNCLHGLKHSRILTTDRNTYTIQQR